MALHQQSSASYPQSYWNLKVVG